MKENIAEEIYRELKEGNPIPTLVNLLSEVLETPVKREYYGQVGKLVKIFGRYVVFFAILDLAKIEVPLDNFYGILYEFAKRRFEREKTLHPNLKAYEPFEFLERKPIPPEVIQKFREALDGKFKQS